jgi:glutamate-1-semialdehyde 2,1-aminomutase
MKAVHGALDEGTHFGANHPREVAWAQQVRALIPSAERVRFTSSGTEATLMALRLARAFTAKTKIVRLMTHFHGWHDHMANGYNSHFDGTPSTGVIAGVAENVILVPPGDIAAVSAAFAAHDDIAALILEPTGGSFGHIPLPANFLADLRALTSAHGVILIFDEVVTGFRVASGGAQAHYGVTPDLTSLAKILAGGLPGGAVCGRKDLLDGLDFAVSAATGREKIYHPGTFNANPVSAAAGTAALAIVGSTDACARANAYGEKLRGKLNEAIEAAGLPWACYGTFSGFHLFLNPRQRKLTPSAFDPAACELQELKQNPPGLAGKLRLAMLVNGVDVNGRPGGIISATHGEAELAHTVDAFRESLAMLRAEGEC